MILPEPQDNTPSYYAIIPAHVRYSKDLEPMAKLFYGELTALANKHGYCWASNAYFAELYGVDIRTVQRWLDSLKKNNFIVVHVERNKLQTTRKIFITTESSNNFYGVTKMSGGGAENAMGGGQKCHPNSKQSIKEDLIDRSDAASRESENPGKGPINTRGEKIAIDESEIYAAMVKYDYPTPVVTDAIAIMRKQKEPIRDVIRYVEATCNNIVKSKKRQEAADLRAKKAKGPAPLSGAESPNAPLPMIKSNRTMADVMRDKGMTIS